jgi:hypothetical protein
MGNWKSVPLMLVATLITGPVTAEMDFPAWTQSDWRIEENRAALNARTPASMRTPVLILGENRRTASESVVILIDAPFESVRPVVEQVWEKRGYAVEKASLPLADLVSQWQQIMLAAQPDLCSALVDGVYGPALAQAVKEGALTETERRQRLQRIPSFLPDLFHHRTHRLKGCINQNHHRFRGSAAVLAENQDWRTHARRGPRIERGTILLNTPIALCPGREVHLSGNGAGNQRGHQHQRYRFPVPHP